jgi:hypothetical protein
MPCLRSAFSACCSLQPGIAQLASPPRSSL